MKNRMPRILFAASKSGSGKTLITCGMLEVCKRRSLRVVSVKCGPDYIDPMFHRRVLGVPCGNLDTYFTEDEVTRYLLHEKARDADLTVMEGVMGYYDGLGGVSSQASTYEAARVTETPVILIADAKGASVSLAAMINGFLQYRKDHQICGVILNRASAGYYERLKELLERECGIRVFGFLPELPGLEVPSRHLGLVSPRELPSFTEWIGRVADAMEQTIDIGGILAAAGEAPYCEGTAPELPKPVEGVRIAVARDEAFSFYYAENMELLERMGAELICFSPLHDGRLPDGINGLLLGGGYPELAAARLQAAEDMRRKIRKACNEGLPCLAECGGFLYLQKELEGADHENYRMAGVLTGRGFRTDRLRRFGYIQLESRTAGLLGDSGQLIKGHEFHYWDCTENGSDFTAGKPLGGTKYGCMVHTPTMAAGFPHLYYYSNPEMIYRFLTACSKYAANRPDI